MLALGIKLTGEDMARIAAAVGTMAVNMAKEADSDKDLIEAAELCKLHFKLVNGLKKAEELSI
jgi:hypothetical protein